MTKEFNLSEKEDTFIDWCDRIVPYDEVASRLASEKRCKELNDKLAGDDLK